VHYFAFLLRISGSDGRKRKIIIFFFSGNHQTTLERTLEQAMRSQRISAAYVPAAAVCAFLALVVSLQVGTSRSRSEELQVCVDASWRFVCLHITPALVTMATSFLKCSRFDDLCVCILHPRSWQWRRASSSALDLTLCVFAHYTRACDNGDGFLKCSIFASDEY
jgi:hypothetical protein